MAKPAVIVVGADKGGVGKTTVSRTVLDYFSANNVPTRAFDTESPRGTLKRFHPDVTEIVDVTSTSDQMKIFDTLNTASTSVTVIDVRAGQLSPTLASLREIRPDHLCRVPHPRPVDRVTGRDRRDRKFHAGREIFPGEEFHQQHQLLRMGPGDLQFLFPSHQGRHRTHHPQTQRNGL